MRILRSATAETGGNITTTEAPAGVFDSTRAGVSSTTQLPKEKTPPTGDLMLTVDDSDLLDVVTTDVDTKKEKTNIQQPVTQPVTQPVAQAKEQLKKEVKVEPKSDPLVGIAPKPKGPATTQARDLTGYSPEEQAVFKQMSNPAFEYTTKLLKEKKELEKLKDSHYLQSPDGYTLTPEYKELSSDMHYVTLESQILIEQLEKISAGEEWTPLVGWSKNGKPVYGDKRAATAADAERIRLNLGKCSQIEQQVREKLQQLPHRYQGIIEQDNQAIKAKMTELFAWEKDPTILEQAIDVNGKEVSIKHIKNDIASLFPPYHRNTIAVEAASNLYVALRIYANEINSLKQQLDIANIKKQEALRSEPTAMAQPVAKSSQGGIAMFDLEGLPKE